MRMQNFAIQFPLGDNKGAGREGGQAGGTTKKKSALSSLLSSNRVRALLECSHVELTHSCAPLAAGAVPEPGNGQSAYYRDHRPRKARLFHGRPRRDRPRYKELTLQTFGE